MANAVEFASVDVDDASALVEVNGESIGNFVVSSEDHAFRNLLAVKKFAAVEPCADLDAFLDGMRPVLDREISTLVGAVQNIKFSICVHASYSKITDPEREPISGFLRTKLCAVIGMSSVMPSCENAISTIQARHVNFMRESSGLRLRALDGFDFSASKYNPLARAGSGFVELPNFLLLKKAIVNVQNNDNRCFAYAVLSALHPQSGNVSRTKSYDKYFTAHPKLLELHYPVSTDKLEEVEGKLEIPINVFSFFDDEGRGRYPVYLSKISQDEAIDLLFWNGHYAWIKNFSRFLADTTKHDGVRFYCKRCLGHFSLESALHNHQKYCISVDDCKQIFTMPPENTKLKFSNVRYQQRFPFVVYADFEAITVTCDQTKTAKRNSGMPIHSIQSHKPISVGMKLISAAAGSLDNMLYETYTGDDVVEWFLRRLAEYRNLCFEYLFDVKRLVMTVEDLVDFEAAVACYICRKPFPTTDDCQKRKSDCKVRDHDHITGAYRGAAHSSCNLKLRTLYKLPVFLHNFRNYDGHLIVPAFTAFKGTQLEVIGQGLEKYLTLTWDKTLVFKDSLQFLSGSLEQLVSCLLKSGKDKFVNLHQEFRRLTDEEGIGLLLRKGIYPYDYMSCKERLQDTTLPPRQSFFNRLQNRECCEEDYEHAKRVWNKFHCKSMQDYHDLYLKCDVLLLADVFESFRTATLSTFGLDPAYYVSAPQLSWDCMMKMTGCELTLLSDPAMFDLINKNLRGGISVITKRHAKANNRYMGVNFDSASPSSYIIYLDANNLYGWAMSEPLPYDDFVWLTAEECESIDWRIQSDDQEYGYFIECDLHYPDTLHEAHNDYPLAPERLLVEEHLLSDKQLDIREQYTISHTSTPKLIPNFFDKVEQLIHYRNLRFYLEHGLILTKVHKAIRFKQSRWLRPYVQTNTELRAMSKDPVEVKLRKDMNNSIYGKTCENLTKRSDIKLVTTREVCEKLINKPHCKRFQVFTPNLAAVELQKIKCLINKPTYVGFTVLELSKLHMYRFHYDSMRTWYPRCELLFTDTDSLVYQVYTDDLYADMAAHREQFDFSGYPETHPLFGEENKMVMGKMKDEAGGNIITEFIGLRPKMYSYTTQVLTPDGEATSKESKRAKGIQRAALAALSHSDYLTQLELPIENYVNIVRIGQTHHRVFTLASRKRGLCAFDDKRYIQSDGIHTLAHGHFRIRDKQLQLEGELPATIQSTSRTQSGDNTIVMTAAEAYASGIRTFTRRQALQSLAGVDLRRTITTVVDKFNVVDEPPVKVRRFVYDDDEGDVGDFELFDNVAQYAAATAIADDY